MVVSLQTLSFRFTASYANSVVYIFGFVRAHTSSFRVFWYIVRKMMAPVVGVELNGSQAFLFHDNAVDDLVQFGWIKFIQSFEGFNLEVAHDFAKTFDGTKANIGDIQL